LSGEVDFIQDVPVQDLGRVDSSDGLSVKTAPQNRVIFFGMDQGKADLENDNVEGANPLADVASAVRCLWRSTAMRSNRSLCVASHSQQA
jgi:hypothetical protein